MDMKKACARLHDSQKSKSRFIAFVTKGLEQISAKEIRKVFPEADILDSSDKYISFSLESVSPTRLVGLKTVDDVHFLFGYFKHIENLDEDFIVKNLPVQSFDYALEFIRELRKINDTFSVTVSKFKNSSINLESLKIRIVKRIHDYTNRTYTALDHSNFDVRVHVESSNLIYSCRIPRTSLYVRAYRKCEMEGSLKPPIAAALCMLVDPHEGEKLVDDLCGSGTILCEAKLQGLEVFGGDIDEKSVTCAQTNIESISSESTQNIKVLDATSTKWPNKCFNHAVSNYPWGKQVALERAVKLYSESIAEYARILKDKGSIVILGTKPELVAKHLRRNFPHHRITQFRIGFLGQTPWVSCALPSNETDTARGGTA
jgi:23S rRNA G2445 N2-methylase RlmL